jgi:hypothetical protein
MKHQKHNIKESNETALCNVNNYKAVIEYQVSDILTKFVSVIVEYMRFISEKIITKNKRYYTFIFERGLDTLIHIFSLILFYTKNIDLTFYYTQKAYYCYIEFIEQISDENAKFLQLSSRDAILFVYKKTIFELNNEYMKTVLIMTEDETSILSQVDDYIYMYKKMIVSLINHVEFSCETKIDYINRCCNKIEHISVSLNKNKIRKCCINSIYLFTHLLTDRHIDTIKIFNLLDEFIKKIVVKKGVDEKIIKNKLTEEEFNNYVEQNGLDKIVNWLFIAPVYPYPVV